MAILDAITVAANQQLLEVGPADPSVRAVARELGMASVRFIGMSVLEMRLLTLLIIGAFDDMADVVEAKARRVADLRRRWKAIGLACRSGRWMNLSGLLCSTGPRWPDTPHRRTPSPRPRIPESSDRDPSRKPKVETTVPAFSARVGGA